MLCYSGGKVALSARESKYEKGEEYEKKKEKEKKEALDNFVAYKKEELMGRKARK